MFVCDCCGQTIMDARPIMRASGYLVPVGSKTYARVVGVERLCAACDESLNEDAVRDITTEYSFNGGN